MFKTPAALSALALALALTAGSAVTSAPAHAYQCKSSPHQAVGVRKLKLAAHSQARKNWTSTASSQYGLSWSVWKIANSKSITCSKLTNGDWRCLASAVPCNYVVQ